MGGIIIYLFEGRNTRPSKRSQFRNDRSPRLFNACFHQKSYLQVLERQEPQNPQWRFIMPVSISGRCEAAIRMLGLKSVLNEAPKYKWDFSFQISHCCVGNANDEGFETGVSQNWHAHALYWLQGDSRSRTRSMLELSPQFID